MTAIKVNAFGGMLPAVDARLIPDNAAALSQNTWLYDGKLAGLVAPTYVKDLVSSASGKVYRIPNSYFDTSHFTDATWMEFPSIDTDVIRSPIVGDTFDRYYWASPSGPPQVNSHARITAGSASYQLGVPQPTAPSALTVAGGSGTTVSRAYTVTFVTGFAEEGPPATPILQTGFINGTWNLTISPPSAPDIATYNLLYARIYRTITVGSVATYFFVAQVAVGTTTYADTILDAVVSLNNILPSTTWTAPPSDLQGWVTLPNGMLAGWRGSEIWFCEPYRPHAWPAQYAVTSEFPVVGLGVINQTLVVLTAGYPLVATGLNPSAMSLSKLAALEPCLSRGSILSTTDGVFYASPNGLICIANGAASNVTVGLVMKDEWNRLNNIPVMRATRLANAYFCYGSARTGFAQLDTWQTAQSVPASPNIMQLADFAGAYQGAIIDVTNQRVAFNTLTSATPVTNIFTDAWSGETVMIRDGKVYRLDISNETAARTPYLWRSKLFQPTDKKNFGAMRIYFEIPPWAPTQSPVRNTAAVQTLAANQYGLVRLYADGTLVMTRELRTSGELMKIPAGFKADTWQIEFEGVVKIASVQMATSDKELKKI